MTDMTEITAWMSLFDQPFFRRLAGALFHFLWQGAAVAALFAAPTSRSRGAAPPRTPDTRSPARRSPRCCSCRPRRSRRARCRPDRRLAPSGPPPPSRHPAGTGVGLPAGAARTNAAPALSSLAGARVRIAAWRPYLLAAWLAGVFFLSARLLAGWAGAARLVRARCVPARAALLEPFGRLARRLSVSRPVRLLESAAVRVPTAIGILRPVILLPVSSLTGLPPRQIEALLAHELAHVRRHDYLVNLVQSAAETLLFYHPAVWWVSGRIRAERENCCDDLAVAATGSARLYAEALVRLEEERARLEQRPDVPPRSSLAADGGGPLFRRIVRLFPLRSRPRRIRRGRAAAWRSPRSCSSGRRRATRRRRGPDRAPGRRIAAGG